MVEGKYVVMKVSKTRFPPAFVCRVAQKPAIYLKKSLNIQ